MDEKKKYRVTNPVAWGGRRERGEILELTADEAVAIGEVEIVVDESATEQAPGPATESAEAPVEPAPEQAQTPAKSGKKNK